MLAWQVDPATYVMLKVNDGSSFESAMAIAESLTWVDHEEWTSRYPVSVDAPVPATAPATTLPATTDAS